MPLFKIDSTETAINSGHNEDLLVNFPTPIELGDSECEIALAHCSLWYSWVNISATEYSNATWRYYNGSVWRANVTMPDGMYSLLDIQNYVEAKITANGDTPANIQFNANYATGYCDIVLVGGYQFDFSLSSFGNLLGFTASSTVTVSATSPSKVDITRGVTSVGIACNVVTGSYANSRSSRVLHTFAPASAPGSLLTIEPASRIYLPVNTKTIWSLRVSLIDNLGRPLHIGSDPVTVVLHIQKAKS